MFNGSGIVGVDIDGCINEARELSPAAQEIIGTLNSYTELSPSGKGVHILLKGTLPAGARKNSKLGLEMYDTGRYFTVTGQAFTGTPLTIEERQEQLTCVHSKFMTTPPPAKKQSSHGLSSSEAMTLSDSDLIEKAKSAKGGDKFTRLWTGNISEYNSDHSSADMALCCLLAFWTGKDAHRIDVLFRQSGLYREKWDKQHYSDGRTYGQATIQNAIVQTTEVYIGVGAVIGADVPPSEKDNKYAEWQVLFKNTSYEVNEQGCLCKIRESKDGGTERIRLANFTARIKKEVVRDDGQASQMIFAIDGILSGGRLLPTINVSSSKFPAMAWPVEHWGAATNINPGTSNKDNMRHAIQSTGFNCPKETIFTHTGWREINGKWIYLHGGGAIGAENIAVDLEEAKLTNYCLPPITNTQEAAKTTLKCLKLAPPEVTYPLMATIFLAPLCEAMRQAYCEPSFIPWVSGMTGAQKSTLVGIFLSHFGCFSGKALPGSFKDTANNLERKAFLLKDTVFCVDDFHPVGSVNEKRTMETKTHALIRGYGDRIGRGRMNSDTSLRQSYPPRGLCIITGEDVPNIGQSATARILNIELQRGQVDLDLLTQLQGQSHLLAQTMAGFIEWLRPQMKDLPAKYRDLFIQLRTAATTKGMHGRIPEAISSLYLGAGTLFSYMVEIGVINETQKEEELLKIWEILIKLGENQGRSIAEDSPTEKFLSALQELITTRRVIIKPIADIYSGGGDSAEHIGWQDDLYYYLLPGTTYKAVCQFYQQQGGIFSVGEKTLWKHLEAAEKIKVKTDNNKTERTFPKLISGISKYHRVLHLSAESLK